MVEGAATATAAAIAGSIFSYVTVWGNSRIAPFSLRNAICNGAEASYCFRHYGRFSEPAQSLLET
jgi:hypothetical protein